MKPTPETAEPEVSPEAAATLELFHACNELFGGSDEPFPLKSLDGKKVEFKAAKVKHLEAITTLIGNMASTLSKAEIGLVVKKVSAAQERALQEGSSPYDLDTLGMTAEVLDNATIISKLVGSGLRMLPSLAPLFTNLTEEEFGELEPDEGLMVVFGVFARNYSFFTRRLPPVIAAFVGSIQMQKM